MDERRTALLYGALALVLLAVLAWQVPVAGRGNALVAAGRAVTAPVVGAVIGGVDLVRRGWEGYVALVGARRERDELRARLERLETDVALCEEVRRENDRLREMLDLVRSGAFRRALVARVVGDLSSGPRTRMLLVDRGRRDGVGRGWVAIHRGALVGLVLRAGRRSAEVMTLEDPDAAVAVRHREGRYVGVLHGGGRGAAVVARLDYVPRDRPVVVGDTLVTSGLDGVYPPGLVVGTVRALGGDSPLTWTIRVELAFTGSTLEEVLLVPPPPPVERPGGGEDRR